MEKADVSIDSKEKVFDLLKNALLKKGEIIFAYLHGSFLDGFLFNDIDAALYLDDKKIPREKTSDYCEQLNMELSELVRFVVDVHILNHAPVGFQHSVFKHGQLLFSKDDELRSDLIEKISMEYMDFYELSMQYIRDIVYHGN
jgi:predicted nucleotidyltransferase